MTIHVKPETEAWLKAEVDAGRFTSVDAAVDALVIEHKAAWLDIEDDDHLWARPQVQEALDSLDRDEGSSLEDVERRLRSRLIRSR